MIARGRVLGVVPKSYLPNYREYYEKRWFAPGIGLTGLQITLGREEVPFGPDLIFGERPFRLHLPCRDLRGLLGADPPPPSSLGALAGALILTNLSASNIVVGKERERDLYGASSV